MSPYSSLFFPYECLRGFLCAINFTWSDVVLQGLNGILADEMGLGKTIQAMAFLAHLAEVSWT